MQLFNFDFNIVIRSIPILYHGETTFIGWSTSGLFWNVEVVWKIAHVFTKFSSSWKRLAIVDDRFVPALYHYGKFLITVGLHLLPGNPTYNLTDLSASDVLDYHKLVLTSFGIQTTDEELDLPYIYWIPKMHKNPFNTDSLRVHQSVLLSKPLSIILTKSLTRIKQGLQKYCETSFSRSGVNQMWILKNSKELLEHLQSPNFNHITNINSFYFSNL